MTTTPPGWYGHPDDQAYEFYWDGAAWTGDSRPTGTLVPSPLPAAAAAKDPSARRIRPLWIGVGAGALVLVAAVVVAVLLLAQPRYPDSSPLTRDDLASIATALGVPTDARTGDSAILLGSSPSECGIVAQFGTGLWAQADVDSGQPFYQVWGFGSTGDPWVNARLFPTTDDATAFVDEVESAASACGVFTRPGDDTEWHDRDVSRDGDRVTFTFDSTTAVVASKDNAVFLFLFDGDTADQGYVDSALG